jgi:hypothetical protein
MVVRPECRFLFVGPSYIRAQFLPEAFDAEAERIGLGGRSCKFGRSSLRGYEVRHELERLLSHDWPKLELVVIDTTLGSAKVGFQRDNWLKPRLIAWHTLDALPWLWKFYERDARSWHEKAPVVATHVEHVAANYAGLGRATSLLSGLADTEQEAPTQNEPVSARKHDQLLRKLTWSKRAFARDEKYGTSRWPLELRSLVRAHGAEAWFLHAPVWKTVRQPGRAHRGSDRLVLLDFNDPERFPELYRPKARGNTQHISPETYSVYSRLLAREVQRRLEATR